MEEQMRYIFNRIKNATDARVTIIIGEAATIFKTKMYQGNYDTLTTAEDVRNFLAKWNTPYDKPIVFEDLALMVPRVQTFLLKFIEEPPAPLIILSSRDNVSPIILSRCKNIIKVPSTIETHAVPVSQFVQERIDFLNEQKAKKYDENQDIEKQSKDDLELESLQRCPEYFYMTTKIRLNREVKNIDKYLSLLS